MKNNNGNIYIESLIALSILSIMSIMLFTGFLSVEKSQIEIQSHMDVITETSNIATEIRSLNSTIELKDLIRNGSSMFIEGFQEVGSSEVFIKEESNFKYYIKIVGENEVIIYSEIINNDKGGVELYVWI